MSASQLPIFDGPETVNLFAHRRQPDFRIRNEGSIWLLFTDTQAAVSWVEENIPPNVSRWCGSTVIECSYVEEVVRGIIDAGLVVRGE